MLSLKLAKQLKDAGLKWLPEDGDFFSTGIDQEWDNIFVVSGSHNLVPELGGKRWFFNGHLCNRDGGCIANSTASMCMNMKGIQSDRFEDGIINSVERFVFVPRLDQLISEIVKRGYRWFPDMNCLEESAGKTLLWIIGKKEN